VKTQSDALYLRRLTIEVRDRLAAIGPRHRKVYDTRKLTNGNARAGSLDRLVGPISGHVHSMGVDADASPR